jgi:DNA-binding NtrC family response regulator
LHAAVAQGRFESGLLFAFSAATVRLPPLRERRDDLPLLIDHFVKRFTCIERNYSGEIPRVADDALDLLMNHNWPGNLDELQAVVRGALLEGRGTVQATLWLRQMLAASPAQPFPPSSSAETDWSALVEKQIAGGNNLLYDAAVDEMERHILPLVMERCGGSQVKAARALGMTRGSLRKKLRHHALLSTPDSLGEEMATENPES